MTKHDMIPFAGELRATPAPALVPRYPYTVDLTPAWQAIALAAEADQRRTSAIDRLAHCRDMMRSAAGREGAGGEHGHFADIVSAVLDAFALADTLDAEGAALAEGAAR